MIPVKGYAAQSANAPLQPYNFERRNPGPNDIVIDILYCGICHSDVHQVKDEWSGASFPMVPGHEIVGRVIREAEKRSQSITELPLEVLRQHSPTFDADYFSAVTLDAAIRRKSVPGGTSVESVRAALEKLQERLGARAAAQ